MKKDSIEEWAQVDTPADPAANYTKPYFKSDGKLYGKTGSVETLIGPGAGSGSTIAAGFRGITDQSCANNASVPLLVDSTAEHNVGSGFTVSGSVVTVAAAGIYQIQGFVQFKSVANAARCMLWIEGWTGTDPGVGSCPQFANSDVSAIIGTPPGFLCAGQVSLQAGHKLRLVTLQGGGTTITTWGSLRPTAFNIRRIESGVGPVSGHWEAVNGVGGSFGGNTWTGICTVTLTGCPVGAVVHVQSVTSLSAATATATSRTRLTSAGATFSPSMGANGGPLVNQGTANTWSALTLTSIITVTAANPTIGLEGWVNTGTCSVDALTHMTAVRIA